MQRNVADKAYRIVKHKGKKIRTVYENQIHQTTLHRIDAKEVTRQRLIDAIRCDSRQSDSSSSSDWNRKDHLREFKSRSDICFELNMQFVRYYSEKYPDFLPIESHEKYDEAAYWVQIGQMIEHRKSFRIPEFYVGSILSVVTHAPESETGEMKFVGICIWRRHTLKRHTFCLRNVVNGEGFEVEYYLYTPRIKSIEVLKLQKWLDADLNYLRDCHPKYSTFPSDMPKTPHSSDLEVPIFKGKIQIGPKPWQQDWFLRHYHNLMPIEMSLLDYRRMRLNFAPWEAFDLVKIYLYHKPCEYIEKVLRYVQKELE
ncbi:MAG: mitochondrial 54S ribosomal protein YmL19 [Marteilia pararefringens]